MNSSEEANNNGDVSMQEASEHLTHVRNSGRNGSTTVQLVRDPTIVHYRGEDGNHSNKRVNQPTQFVAHLARIQTKFWWLNWGWLVLYSYFIPAAFGAIWFGVIPIGRTDDSSRFKEIAVWAFLINPGTYVFFSFMITNIFMACLDSNRPWRPFKYYAPILVVNYILQVGILGTISMLWEPFPALGLAAIFISIGTTLGGLKMLPHNHFDCNKERFDRIYWQFVKIMATFAIFWFILLGYIIANGEITSSFQGLLTAALAFITFIFKKILLAQTDTYPIEIAMVISGLWLENVVDIFIALAYPTATQLGITFLTIWLTRVAEDVAFLGFQLDMWFRFRVWIKGVLTGKRGVAIEEDLDLNDRGHSNQHPGYRRRQMRFLVWKLASRMSSTVFYLAVIPVLRYGVNREFYPYTYQEIRYVDVFNDDVFENDFTLRAFKASMSFAIFSLLTFIVPWGIIFFWMRRYHRDILEYIKVTHSQAFLSEAYFGFVLTILIANVLLGVSAVQIYNRLYFF
ncbi:hypothetical protein BSKO_05442 [Bryopsis sp. KO-2023]|nr:hypothetical protein BSKO_05442 [Bryopsis sp. KO-2023]